MNGKSRARTLVDGEGDNETNIRDLGTTYIFFDIWSDGIVILLVPDPSRELGQFAVAKKQRSPHILKEWMLSWVIIVGKVNGVDTRAIICHGSSRF